MVGGGLKKVARVRGDVDEWMEQLLKESVVGVVLMVRGGWRCCDDCIFVWSEEVDSQERWRSLIGDGV